MTPADAREFIAREGLTERVADEVARLGPLSPEQVIELRSIFAGTTRTEPQND